MTFLCGLYTLYLLAVLGRTTSPVFADITYLLGSERRCAIYGRRCARLHMYSIVSIFRAIDYLSSGLHQLIYIDPLTLPLSAVIAA